MNISPTVPDRGTVKPLFWRWLPFFSFRAMPSGISRLPCNARGQALQARHSPCRRGSASLHAAQAFATSNAGNLHFVRRGAETQFTFNLWRKT